MSNFLKLFFNRKTAKDRTERIHVFGIRVFKYRKFKLSPQQCTHIKYLWKKCSYYPHPASSFIKAGGDYLPEHTIPRSFTEKIVYYLYNYFLRTPIYMIINDKLLVKDYVKKVLGTDKNIIKTLAVWDNAKDVNLDGLPNSFVLKATFGCAAWTVMIIKDKTKIDIKKLRRRLKKWQRNDNIKIKYFAEEYITENNKPLMDYKIFCFNGRAIFARVGVPKSDVDSLDDKLSYYYSLPDWKKLPIGKRTCPIPSGKIPRPQTLEQMIKISEKLAQPFAVVRIDLYESDGRVYFGEITPNSADATVAFIRPSSWDFKFGDMIKLPSVDEIRNQIDQDIKKYAAIAAVRLREKKETWHKSYYL